MGVENYPFELSLAVHRGRAHASNSSSAAKDLTMKMHDEKKPVFRSLGGKLLIAPYPFNKRYVQKLLDDGYSQVEIDELAQEVIASWGRFLARVNQSKRRDRKES